MIDLPYAPDSAFPITTEEMTVFGLNRREYFAARAPVVPDWFYSRYATKDEDYPREATDEEFNAIHRRNQSKRFEAEEKAFFAWRLFYADQMIAALGVGGAPLQRAITSGEDKTGLGTVRDAIAYMLEGSPTHQMEMVVPVNGKRINIEIYITKIAALEAK